MNTFRRRPGGRPSPHDDTHVDSSGQNTPIRESTPDADGYKLVHETHLNKLKQFRKNVKGNKRRTAWIFGLGGLFGLLLAAFFANQNDLLDLAALGDIDFQGLMDVLPATFLREAKQFQV